MRGARDKRELTAIESEENAAMPLRPPQSHGRHDGGGNKSLPCACVQSSEYAYGQGERGFSTASLGFTTIEDEDHMPMNISLILGHPWKESLCHAIAETAATTLRANRHIVAFHDLYVCSRTRCAAASQPKNFQSRTSI